MVTSSLPRVVVAAPSTGQGKTTIATGLIAALRQRGLAVSGHKVGPDYIDPGYHALASGRPGRNLDPHLVGPDLIAPLLLHGATTPQPADMAVVEGVMGLYDGRIGGEGFASTAHVAALIDSPVVLVVDIARSSRTVAALVHGLASWDPRVRVGGVILNRAGSPRQVREVVDAMPVPVLGVVPREAEIATPSRHLGLVTAAERDGAAEVVQRLGELVATHVDLDAVLALARSAPPLAAEAWRPPALLPARQSGSESEQPVVAVAGGRAFTFHYAETTELLQAAGCRVIAFDPTTDPGLPDGTAGLYLGGGFPEEHAVALADNRTLRDAIREAVTDGLPTVAECAGLLYLCRSLDGAPMTGVLDADAAMTTRLTLRYPTAIAATDSLLTTAGDAVTGHEFHRTCVTPGAGGAGSGWRPAWHIDADAVGFTSARLHASYLHTHWAGHPRVAERFVAAVHGD